MRREIGVFVRIIDEDVITTNPRRVSHKWSDFKTGDVWYGAYPFMESDDTYWEHPCLVLNTDLGKKNSQLVVIRIDSLEQNSSSYNPDVEFPISFWKNAGLSKSSVFSLDSVRFIDSSLLYHCFGKLFPFDWSSLHPHIDAKWKMPRNMKF